MTYFVQQSGFYYYFKIFYYLTTFAFKAGQQRLKPFINLPPTARHSLKTFIGQYPIFILLKHTLIHFRFQD